MTPQGQLLVAGWEDEQIPGHPAAFIWVLDETGMLAETKTIEPPGGFSPSYFIQEQGEYLVSGALANSGLGFIQALDVDDLTETWSYTLSTPADQVFSGVAPVVVDSNMVYLPGNLLRHKFPHLNLYAYQDAFVAAINPLQQEEIWQHRSSAVGLSYVDVYWHGIDRKGDLVVFTTEFKAPDDTLPYFPASSTMYKCSTDGTLLWWRLLAPDWGAAPNAFTSPVFDLQNNIIFPLVHQSNGATYLAKWSETGQFIDSFKFDAYWMKLDAQHHLLLAGGNGINHVGFLLNDQFDILKSQTLSGYPIESFILPGHAGSYAYVYEKQDVFPYQAIFKMYHDWDLVWERSIPLVGPYNSGMNKSMVDPVTGDLIFLASYTTNASGQLMYRLSFNGELNQIPFDGTTTDVIQMHCLKNRNFFLRRANTVECYDSTGLLINSVPFSAIYGHHSFVFGDWFFYFRSDSLGHWQISAFDAQGNYRYLFDCGKWLNYTLLTNTMDSTYAYYAPNFLGGNVWVGGPWFVRKWQRAVVSKFSLNHFLTVSAHSPDDKGVQLTCIPNPANDAFRIELPQGIGINDVRWMEALSADGRLMCQTTGMPTDQTVVCTAWPSGCYWVRVICEDGRVFSSSVVKPE
ncbi:MAG: hypothetical protein JNJ57_08335 [Saprospiraceae bacterium]|nr:hypothetical protein [Saprospiraceae bacterium]